MHKTKNDACKNVVAVADEPHHHLVVENEWIRVYAVEVGPHENTLCHRHALPYLMYVAGSAEIISAPRHGEARKHHYVDTCCEFSPPGLEHAVENLADERFRNLIIEVLPAAEKLHRSGLPFAGAAGVRMSRLYSGETLCAQLIELSSGSQTQVTGPAVVGSPYEDPVEFISPQRGTRKLDDFQKLEYVPDGSTGLLRCEAGQPARVIVVTVGCE